MITPAWKLQGIKMPFSNDQLKKDTINIFQYENHKASKMPISTPKILTEKITCTTKEHIKTIQNKKHIFLTFYFFIHFFMLLYTNWHLNGNFFQDGQHVNSLWPSDAIWRQKTGSTLAQVMACCLTAPSHYLNQYWLIITKVQWHSSDSSFTTNASAISHWN